MADTGTPLCTWAQFTSGAFKDMARNITDLQTQSDLLIEATRLCEQEAGRRLVPFTGMVETHRAQGIDPDEYGNSADLPLDMSGSLGRSYADALGAGNMVRHCWLNEYAPRYPEMWAYSNVSVQIVRSYGGSQNLTATQITGPEPDSGHIWFNLGLFVPIGSIVRVTYGGGYTTIPADLVRAGKYMTASIIARELAPTPTSRDPETLRGDAVAALAGYIRD